MLNNKKTFIFNGIRYFDYKYFNNTNKLYFIVHPLWGKYFNQNNNFSEKYQNILIFKNIKELFIINNNIQIVLVFPPLINKNTTENIKETINKLKYIKKNNLFILFSEKADSGIVSKRDIKNINKYNGEIILMGGYLKRCLDGFGNCLKNKNINIDFSSIIIKDFDIFKYNINYKTIEGKRDFYYFKIDNINN